MIQSKLFYVFVYLPVLVALVLSTDVRRDFASVSLNRHVATLLFLVVVNCLSLRKRSVSPSAVPAICLMGYIISVTSGVYAASIIGFLILGSKVTKVGSSIKHRFQEDYKPEGHRKWNQIVSNAGIAVLLCLATMYTLGHGEQPVEFQPLVSFSYHKRIPSPRSLLSSYLHLAILGAISCCCGDTFASELGTVYANKPPVLITKPWRYVPIGTNGGVTLSGIGFSALGGTLQGLIHYIFTVVFCYSPRKPIAILLLTQWPMLLIGLFGGLIGGLVDSLLGATLQFSGLDLRTNKVTEQPGKDVRPISGIALLDNDLVNFVSSLVTAAVIPFLASFIIL